MKLEDIKKIAVLGAGQMGRQIALNNAVYGFDTYVYDSNVALLDDVQAWADDYIKGRVDKGKLNQEQASATLAKFHVVKDLAEAVVDADIAIEAIIEDIEIKKDFFKQVDQIAKKDAIIATNSSFMVSSMFKDIVSNPSRLVNLHYFNPALVMKLTEVVQGSHTSEETVNTLLEFSKATGKNPIWVKQEIDGFVANRILRAVTNEALDLLEKGIASPEDIDTAAEKGLNYPMGPFRLMDFTGVDTCYLVAKIMLEEQGFRKPGYDYLQEKYEKKEWGRKVGKGWYDYSKK